MTSEESKIGLRQAKQLCQMSHPELLDFLAEGLPIILKSAQGYWSASQQLKDAPREAIILESHAKEEAAKALILMDAVRCPKEMLPSRLGTIVKWFYDHLARLIYAEAAHLKPMHLAQLRDYVALERRSHCVDGGCGEYIVPSSPLYKREKQLYVDVEANDNGELTWSDPAINVYEFCAWKFTPPVLLVIEAMSVLGMFTLEGLRATADVWGKVDFDYNKTLADAQQLTQALLGRLLDGKLPTEEAEQCHIDTLYYSWQFPMYNLDISLIPVSRDELRNEQDRMLWSW